jgi:hypothetical protein
MEKEYDQWMEELIKHCPPDCKCHKQGIKNLCKARDVGLESFAECMEENPLECTFALPYDGSYYCKCGPRVYIAKFLRQ